MDGSDRRARAIVPHIALLVLACASTAEAAEGSWLTENLRASIDASSRIIRSQGKTWSLHALGLDVHTVVNGAGGDVGTLVFQPYLVRIDNAPMVPPLFDDEDDHALQWRIANFNYTGLGHGRFNIRVGHFELPYGLEQVAQTNGTLYQMNAAESTGLKADWGVSVNGVLPELEYEVGYMRGGGNDVGTDADGYVVGRVGLPRDNRWWLGVSALDGEMEQADDLINRRLTALDVGARLGAGIAVLFEYSLGTEGGDDVRHLLGEVSWTSLYEITFGYVQWRSSDSDGPQHTELEQLAVGARFEPNARWSASMEVRHGFDGPGGRDTLLAQLRYRW